VTSGQPRTFAPWRFEQCAEDFQLAHRMFERSGAGRRAVVIGAGEGSLYLFVT
jgi:hypothetical protein